MTDFVSRGGSGTRLGSAVPTFLVADVGSTARWYEARLGFRVGGTAPGTEPFAYASVHRDAAEIMLLSLDGYRKPDLRDRRPSGLWDAYIRTDGVEALYRQVENEPFIAMTLRQQPYGDWEFEVRDPNDYVLVFGGRLA